MKPLLSVLMERSTMGPGCWIWNGHKDRHGYGILTVNQTQKMFAHRAAYAVFHPEWDWSDCVLHKCDVPACWNPAHLFNGTQLENIADMHAKGRNKNPPRMIGAANPRATLSEEDIIKIRTMFASGMRNRAIGEAMGIPRWKVWCVTSGKTWQCVSTIDEGMAAL